MIWVVRFTVGNDVFYGPFRSRAAAIAWRNERIGFDGGVVEPLHPPNVDISAVQLDR